MAPEKPTPSDPDPLPALQAAVERLSRAEHQAALASLLEAWRASGDARLADAIDRLSDLLTERETPLNAVGGTSAKTAWYKASSSQRPAVLGRLLEALPSGMDRAKRLDALATWPPDPRIGTAARRWIEEPSVGGSTRTSFFWALWRLIEYTRDARLTPVLTRISQASMQSTSANRYGQRAWVPLVELATRYEALPPPTPLEPDAVVALERIDTLLAKPLPKAAETTADPAPLFARIYADPSDDEPRAVLADLLQQQSDPRGEFIALQMARYGTDKPRTREERKLEQQWGRTWLGPLDHAVAKAGLEFERGFVTRCRLAGSEDEVVGPEWSTLTHLDVSQATNSADHLLLRPGLRNLRHVTGLAPDDLKVLVKEHALPWETVGWRLRYWTSLGGYANGAGTTFAAVRTLILKSIEPKFGLHHATSDELLELLARWPNVTAFEIETDTDHAVRILHSPRGKTIKRLVIGTGQVLMTLEGDKLTVAMRRVNDPAMSLVVNRIQELTPKEVVVYTEGKGALEGEMLVGKAESTSIAPLIAAARTAGATLDVQGTKFP